MSGLKPICGCENSPCVHFPEPDYAAQYEYQEGPVLTNAQLAELVSELGSMPTDGAVAIEDLPRPRSAVDLAMARTDDLPAVVDPRNPVALQQGQNPYIATKEKIIDEVISSKYSLRRGLIRPERGRMLVARTKWDEQLGSIFLTDDTNDQHTATNMEVVVMACGKNRIDPSNGREMHMEYEPDDTIGHHAIIRQHSGLEFIWYDENGKQRVLYLIGQSEIWSWLEPPPGYEEEMQNSPELQRTLKYIRSGLAQKALPAAACCATCFDGNVGCLDSRCECHL